jgi:hypothetical protein
MAPLLTVDGQVSRHEVEVTIQKVLSNEGLSPELDPSGHFGRALLARDFVAAHVRSGAHQLATFAI